MVPDESFATPGYGAPEVIAGRMGISSLSDAYAFVVIAFETLVLLHPFLGDDVQDGEPEDDTLACAQRAQTFVVGAATCPWGGTATPVMGLIHLAVPNVETGAPAREGLAIRPREWLCVTARSLRWALAKHLLARYPARIHCPSRYADAIADGVDWIVTSTGGIPVVRSPASPELASLQRRIGTLGYRTAQFMPRGDNADLIDRLQGEVKAAAESLAELALCPLRRIPRAIRHGPSSQGTTPRSAADATAAKSAGS